MRDSHRPFSPPIRDAAASRETGSGEHRDAGEAFWLGGTSMTVTCQLDSISATLTARFFFPAKLLLEDKTPR